MTVFEYLVVALLSAIAAEQDNRPAVEIVCSILFLGGLIGAVITAVLGLFL